MRQYFSQPLGMVLGTLALAGCGIGNHLAGSARPNSHSVTVTTPSTSPSSFRTTTPPTSRSATHPSTQSPRNSSTSSRVVATSTKGFSENATLFPDGWQVSGNAPNTTSVLISNQSTANFVSYQLGVAYHIFGSPIGMLDPSQANRNSNVQWHIVSQHPSSLWTGATAVTVKGDTTKNGQPFNWTLITYKKVHGVYYFVMGTVGIHTADYRNGVFKQNYQRLVQGFSITNHR